MLVWLPADSDLFELTKFIDRHCISWEILMAIKRCNTQKCSWIELLAGY
jgi:hypothetical protein